MHRHNRGEYPEHLKLQQSNKMKRKILDGSFTPNINNTRTTWDATFDGKKFRSSWEAAFFAIYDGKLEFEKIRILWIDATGVDLS